MPIEFLYANEVKLLLSLLRGGIIIVLLRVTPARKSSGGESLFREKEPENSWNFVYPPRLLVFHGSLVRGSRCCWFPWYRWCGEIQIPRGLLVPSLPSCSVIDPREGEIKVETLSLNGISCLIPPTREFFPFVGLVFVCAVDHQQISRWGGEGRRERNVRVLFGLLGD